MAAFRLNLFSLGLFRTSLSWKYSLSTPPLRLFSQTNPSNSPITAAETNITNKTVQVQFTGNKSLDYPWIFLQDNCTCSDCFHSSSRSRTRKITDLNLNNQIVKVVNHQTSIKCTWADGHTGIFKEKWLLDRQFTDDNIKQRRVVFRDNPKLVDANHQINTETLQDVMIDDSKLLGILKNLSTFGICMIKNAPKQVGELRKLANKIGFLRLTHYGHEFTVKSEMNAVNLAYTSNKLGVHTDLPYYVYPPGVQLLHCIKQFQSDEGGHSHLVDGFMVAHQMKVHFPEEYKILSETSVEFYDIGEDYTKFYKIHHSPTFVHSQDSGKLTRIVYSNQQLSSYQPIPIEKVKSFYSAVKLFTDLCYDPKYLMVFKLTEGDILIMDNWRFLHGREGFDSSKGDRHLEGCYIDWDEIYSKIRVIEADLSESTPFI